MCPYAQKAWIALEGMIRYGVFLVLACFTLEYVTKANFFTPGNMNAVHEKKLFFEINSSFRYSVILIYMVCG